MPAPDISKDLTRSQFSEILQPQAAGIDVPALQAGIRNIPGITQIGGFAAGAKAAVTPGFEPQTLDA